MKTICEMKRWCLSVIVSIDPRYIAVSFEWKKYVHGAHFMQKLSYAYSMIKLPHVDTTKTVFYYTKTTYGVYDGFT